MAGKTRAFLAIEIPEKVSKEIAELQNFLKLSDADASWVSPSNFHYNLKFFGYLTDEGISKAIEITQKLSSSVKPFDITIQNIGAFPSIDSPRVVWLGTANSTNELASLAASLDKAYSEAGIPCADKKFTAHLTLCRLKSFDNTKQLTELAKQKQRINIGTFKANELVLFKSVLTKTGPIYKLIKKFRLGG